MASEVQYVSLHTYYLGCSSYTLVMTALDRFQSICYPMVHRVWKPRDSHRKIAVAWATALALCVPQAFIFGAEATLSGQVGCVAYLGSIDGMVCSSWCIVAHLRGHPYRRNTVGFHSLLTSKYVLYVRM
jgi:hypothetical protein